MDLYVELFRKKFKKILPLGLYHLAKILHVGSLPIHSPIFDKLFDISLPGAK